MIVPQHWAESRRQHRARGRQVTVRRYGWSDDSLDEAQAMADRRADEALARLLAGTALPRREPRVPYNGADGVPIREEIVERRGDVVVTRNSYGARCLNTPDVMFADVDFGAPPPRSAWLAALLVGLSSGVALALTLGAARTGFLLALGGGVLALLLMPLAHRTVRHLAGGEEAIARRRIARYVAAHPDWHLRLYRTPAGLRLLAMHARFDARDPAVQACFDAIGADPAYARMCRHQRCFRARLSPKPWRLGIGDHLRPRPGVWPVDEAQRPARAAWTARHEAAARGHAACRFMEALGATSRVDAKAEAVRQLHDEAAGATSGRPIA